MNNKSNSLQKKRIWTDIAEDIGYVLRKQMLNQQILSRSQKKHQVSSHVITKSLFENPKIAAATQQNRNTKVYFVRGNTRSLNSNVESQKYPKISNLKSIKKIYDEDQEQSTLNDFSRGKILSQQKRREAQMLKSYLHKLKVQNNVRKIHNLRQKSYKVWKLRITNSTKKNQLHTSEQHYS